jgi:hypothetical protein
MKNLYLILFLSIGNPLFSQTVADLSFTTNVPDAENHWVVLQKKEKNNYYNVGFIYFDEQAGYSLKSAGTLAEDNGKLKYIEDPNAKISSITTRIGNLEYKSAVISSELLKSFKLPNQPDWLKFYISSESENQKIVNRASIMNGNGLSKSALPKLEKLYKDNFKTDKLYFELAFAYNALGDFANAEKICFEAVQNKLSNDLINKEYVFAFLHQKKISEADVFLTKNLDHYKNKSYKYESMMNIIAISAQLKNIDLAKKWLGLLKKDNDVKNVEHIKKLEELIAKNQ